MINELKDIKLLAEEFDKKLENIKIEIEEKQKEYREKVSNVSNITEITEGLNEEEFKNFIKEPYAILPTGKQEEWFVAVPKFIKMNLGWLDHATETFNVFRINKFMKWLGNIPSEIEKKFKFDLKLPIKVFDGMVLTGEEHQDETWNKYNKFLTRREGKDKIKIKQGYEFKLLAQLISDGILPFIPKPVSENDLKKDYEPNIKLRDYQRDAYNRFLEVGAVGIYWAYSGGKTFIGNYTGAKLKGYKLVVVPSTTLKEQWEERIRKNTPECKDEFVIITYQSFKNIESIMKRLRIEEWALVIFDECQHLPANTYSRFATIKTKFRMGCSATPYREDGRTDYIFALTGFPIGLSWENLIELGVLNVPDVRCFVVADWREKEKKLKELLQIDKKTIIFCDTISIGERLSKSLGIPFIYGATNKRLDIIKEAETCIISRVGDEGLSIPEIRRVIEIDFLYGSRRQEGQRLGRLFHGEEKGEHIILMTEKEFEDYNKRLYAITEKGFKLEIIR
jgi:DNA excision repair protein ERCC-3